MCWWRGLEGSRIRRNFFLHFSISGKMNKKTFLRILDPSSEISAYFHLGGRGVLGSLHTLPFADLPCMVGRVSPLPVRRSRDSFPQYTRGLWPALCVCVAGGVCVCQSLCRYICWVSDSPIVVISFS